MKMPKAITTYMQAKHKTNVCVGDKQLLLYKQGTIFFFISSLCSYLPIV